MDSDSFGSCRAVQKHPLTTTPPITGVGIDVGGVRKGFHAVALRDGVDSEKAEQHPSGYFDWMRRGADLYEALVDSHPLLTSLPSPGQRCCFETFPHAITWHLRNGEAKARQKRPQRTAL